MKRYIKILGLFFIVVFGACSGSDNEEVKDIYTPPLQNQPDVDFVVTISTKTEAHPYYNQGNPEGFRINNVEGQELTLRRGVTYKFSVKTGHHPFYISTSDVGAGEGEYTAGVKNGRITNGILEFTPDSNTPDLLYYQCFLHPSMGYIINIVD